MQKIIDMIKEKYLIGCQEIELLENGAILFKEDDGTIQLQTKRECINDYIDFLSDLLEQNRQMKEITHCIDLLDDLKQLYYGLEILNLINK